MDRLNDAIFQWGAILILLLFYLIYFGRMGLQRKKGVKTDQMGRGKKDRALFRTEIVMKTATYSIVVVELISIYLNMGTPFLACRITGWFIGLMGVVVFGLAVYTMHDSWRAGIPDADKTELITQGIFKISRNPASLAFDLLYFGILLMFFNWVLLLFTIWAVVMLHLQILQEERFLHTVFGDSYAHYQRQTKRYLGRNK